jgi:hypothetical protein
MKIISESSEGSGIEFILALILFCCLLGLKKDDESQVPKFETLNVCKGRCLHLEKNGRAFSQAKRLINGEKQSARKHLKGLQP